MAGLKIAVERTAGGVIVRVKGAVDTSTVEDLDRSLATLSGGGQKTVVADLAGTDYVNSRGMALLIKYNDIFLQNGGRFAISNLNERVKPTFELMGLLEALEVVERPEDVFTSPAPEKPEIETYTVACPDCEASLEVEASGYFRCSRCGSVFRVLKNWKVRATKKKKAARVSVVIPMLAKYVSTVRAGIESLAAEFLHNQRKLWPPVDEVLGFLMEKAERGRKKHLQMSVNLAADENRFIIVIALPRGVVVSEGEIKDEPAFKMAGEAFSKIDIAALEPEGQVLRLEK